MASMVLYPRRLLGSHALRAVADGAARLLRPCGIVDRHNRSGKEFHLSAAGDGHHAGAEGSGLMRLRIGIPNRSAHHSPIPLHRPLSNRPELALRITLMILTIISGMEIANLFHPIAALAVMGTACISGVLAGAT